MAGSISNPNVVAAGLNVIVTAVWLIADASTSGLADSVSGGMPQADQLGGALGGTANCDRFVENVSVCPPLESDATGAPVTLMGTTVVLPVYSGVGEEMVKGCANAGPTAAMPAQIAVCRTQFNRIVSFKIAQKRRVYEGLVE